MLKENILQTIGNTPLIKLNFGAGANLFAKAEMFNPQGSVKDRAALSMIEDAFKRGVLARGGVIVEPTSGNTGIGLAFIGALKGCKVILTMPENMSEERKKLLRLLGAQLELTPAKQGMSGAVLLAEQIARKTKGACYLNQFANPANPLAHFEHTAPEIWRDLDGNIDVFISAAGTCGTVVGCGRFFKSKNPAVKIVAVEPAASPVLSGGKSGPHLIQGIGPGFIPDNFDAGVIDEIMTVSDQEALSCAKELARREGLFCGPSAGAAYCAALKLAARPEFKGRSIVFVCPDAASRYI